MDSKDPIRSFYSMTDCMLEIMEFCKWSSLVALSHVDRTGRDRARLLTVLTSLDKTGAMILGTVPWAVTAEKLNDIHLPREMQIVTPSGTFATWAECLLQIGYCMVDDGGILSYDPYVRRVTAFWRFRAGVSILIIEARKPSIFEAVFNLGLTSEMMVLDTSRLYSFYPQLQNKEITLSAFRRPSPLTIKWWTDRAFKHHETTSRFTHTCGYACPAIWRYTDGMKGIGEFAWGGIDNDKDFEGNMGDSLRVSSLRLKWRIGIHCVNEHCQYNSRFYATLSEVRYD
ncbi:hypothetical protein Hypma_002450 [Hypsizygus marmoreus]|uniref:Uncharacterized protein n=1 Tax=Hypsizygus marmoreus TaxID=39966 RepID=A0A369J6B3_HYPMA|nr:hypothetical protein Hypma_002450 [Hypsizygus marmoreus]